MRTSNIRDEDRKLEQEGENCLYRIEGWLNVCECCVEQETHGAVSGAYPSIPWHPGYCVIRQDEQSLICYKDEQSANRVGRHLSRIRLDGGCRAFYRKWGYPEPPSPVKTDSNDDSDDDTLVDSKPSTSIHESLYGTLKMAKAHTSYDLIEAPTGESQSLDRRGGWPHKRIMPSSATTNFAPENNLALVESPSTSHKLANFLSRPFRTNPLKRTKSVSKLDRNKRSALDSDGPSWSSWVGLNNRNNIRNSRSHESLLSYSTTTHAIDLACNGCTVTPLHTSILGAPHCFQISTNTGATKYYACRTAAERDRWLESLRSMQSNHDQVRRQENSLQLWIFASKGIPCKRKYYCELCLDHTLYCRTTSKLKLKDECFWGEQFEINHLPKLNTLCINLYREADRKKKKDRNTLIGYVQIPINILAVRHPVEKWYAVTGAEKLGTKGETPSVRIKARYQCVTILPLRAYENLLQFVQENYLTVCSAVEHLTSVKAKEDIATCMVHILHKQHMAKDFLCDLVMSEVEALDNYHLMFRGNSLATKAMEAYMKLVGDQYLHDTLAEFIQNVLESDEDCEVDPSKVPNLTLLAKQQEALTRQVHLAWGKIVNSFYDFPIELKEVFYELRQRLDNCGRSDLADYLISSNIFLRFLCPSILSPSLFNLIQEYPNDKTVRNLTLIAKTIQTLANFTKFGVKEHYMEFMNKFVEGEWDHMRQYLMRISSAPTRDYLNRCMEWEGIVNLGKELSLLHCYLVESWSHIETNLGSSSTELKKTLDFIDDVLENPSNLMNLSLYKAESMSPTSPISDYENNNNNNNTNNNNNDSHSSFEIAAKKFNFRKLPSSSNGNNNNNDDDDEDVDVDVGCRYKKPASHLNSDDDYVWYTAIDENLGLRRTGLVVQQNRQRHGHANVIVNGMFNGNGHTPSSPGELSAASAVVGVETDGLNYMDDYNGGSHDDSAECIPPLRGSQGSLTTNGPVSSGYQSLNYSTSNSSSPVEVGNLTQKKTQYNGVNGAKMSSLKPTQQPPAPLAISNPLYCMQTVPLIKQNPICYSLPDIQQELNNPSTANGTNGVESTFDDRSPFSLSNGAVRPTNHRWHRGSSAVVANQKQYGPRATRPSLESAYNSQTKFDVQHLSPSADQNGGNGVGKSPVPRTNPRYMMNNNGRSPTLPCASTSSSSSSSNNNTVRPIMRRTKTDCGIGTVSAFSAEETAAELQLRAKFLEDLDETRRRLEDTQAKLKEAEERERISYSKNPHEAKTKWSEQMKPIITRLKLVEYELQEELTTSIKKQQIIDAQQKRIELLQTANENLLAKLNTMKQNSSSCDHSDGYSPLNVKQTENVENNNSKNNNSNSPTMLINNLAKVSPSSSDHSTSISQSSGDVFGGSSTNLCVADDDDRRLILAADVSTAGCGSGSEIRLDFAGLKTTEC